MLLMELMIYLLDLFVDILNVLNFIYYMTGSIRYGRIYLPPGPVHMVACETQTACLRDYMLHAMWLLMDNSKDNKWEVHLDSIYLPCMITETMDSKLLETARW